MTATTRSPLVLGVLGSGKGSNFAAIARAIESGGLHARVGMVISDVPDAGILHLAEQHGTPALHLPPGRFKTKLEPERESELAQMLRAHGVELVVLAGYMRLLKEPLISAFPRRIINIHPSLLPKFPGLEAWRQALEAGEHETGCTVHYVDLGMDTGPIIAQERVPVLPGDTPETLHARIQQAEHTLYPAVIAGLAADQMSSWPEPLPSARFTAMNWLAHILLAGERADDQLGGVLADLVPMAVARTLPAGLRRGIALHHAVDAFSDAHPAVCASNRRLSTAGVGLRPAAAAIAVDMLYDHLLAQSWAHRCPAVSLESFAAGFYRMAAAHEAPLPVEARRVFRYMSAENWLVSYRELDGVRDVLERIRRRLSPRAAAVCPLASAADVFARNPAGFEVDFEHFWPEVKTRALAFLADANTEEASAASACAQALESRHPERSA